jgi:hypothetical protein
METKGQKPNAKNNIKLTCNGNYDGPLVRPLSKIKSGNSTDHIVSHMPRS